MIWNELSDIKKIKQYIENICPNALFVDGYDDCIIGIQLLKPNKTHIVYSQYSMIKKMMIKDDISFDDAYMFFVDILNEIKPLNDDVMPIFRQDIPNPQLN